MRAFKNRLLAIVMLIVAVAIQTAANAQEKVNPHFFGEFTGGIGTSIGIKNVTYYPEINITTKTYTYGQWSPSLGLVLTDRWAIGARFAFQTFDRKHVAKYSIYTLFGQYSILNWSRFHFFAEGKGSYYHSSGYESSLGEIGVSLGAKYNITHHLSFVLYYIYAGVGIGDSLLDHPKGCIGDGRYTLDFSPRRLQIGLRYKF